MSVDERKRHQLYNRAVEVLGEEEAEILMAHLPPGGYPNLATKQDIVLLKQDIAVLKQDIAVLRQEMAALARELKRELNEEVTGLRQWILERDERLESRLKSFTL